LNSIIILLPVSEKRTKATTKHSSPATIHENHAVAREVALVFL
jgi:hypothetical protein